MFRQRAGSAAARPPSTSTTDLLAEAHGNVAAVTAVVEALAEARSSEDAIGRALAVVRDRFGWAYGSHWRVDPKTDLLVFSQEVGDAGPEFREVTLSATFARGVGLSGRAWQARELVFVPDLGEIRDCVRAPAAQRVGVRSGVCFPLLRTGRSSAPWTSSPPRPCTPPHNVSTRCARWPSWCPRRANE